MYSFGLGKQVPILIWTFIYCRIFSFLKMYESVFICLVGIGYNIYFVFVFIKRYFLTYSIINYCDNVYRRL